jgi:hypothetical protein
MASWDLLWRQQDSQVPETTEQVTDTNQQCNQNKNYLQVFHNRLDCNSHNTYFQLLISGYDVIQLAMKQAHLSDRYLKTCELQVKKKKVTILVRYLFQHLCPRSVKLGKLSSHKACSYLDMGNSNSQDSQAKLIVN